MLTYPSGILEFDVKIIPTSYYAVMPSRSNNALGVVPIYHSYYILYKNIIKKNIYFAVLIYIYISCIYYIHEKIIK